MASLRTGSFHIERFGVLLALALGGCSSTGTPAPASGGAGGIPAAGSASGGAGGSLLTTGGSATSGAGGMAGASASGGGAGGAAGDSVGAGAGGGGDAGSGSDNTCSPAPGPGAGQMHATTGWKAQWNVPCDFTSYGGCALVMPPEQGFDNNTDTRTSIGHTHYEHGSSTSQVVGDAFTFDMMGCRKLSKLVLWSSTPPTNQGKNDSRDFPGAVAVRVSSDCTTQDGTITGTFGEVVATGMESQPGCLRPDCTLPLTITIDPPVAAKCVNLELTKVCQLGGDIWWSITELQAFE